jgi:hypothetical protein
MGGIGKSSSLEKLENSREVGRLRGGAGSRSIREQVVLRFSKDYKELHVMQADFVFWSVATHMPTD